MLLTCKYRLYPTNVQAKTMSDTCWLCSIVYNRFLAERIDLYGKEKKSIRTFDQINAIPSLKNEIPRLKDVFSQTLQEVPRRLQKSFDAFFRRIKSGDKEKGFPKFRPARTYDSFTYPQSGFKLVSETNRVELSKIGSVKIKLHRPIQGKIKTLTIRRRGQHWYACFSCEIETTNKEKTNLNVGVDVGLTNLLATSDGILFPPAKHLRNSERKLKRLQRAVSRKKKGGSNRRKAVRKLARLHERITNQRKDTAFKAAHSLFTHYDGIAIEDLSIKNMVQDKYLSKPIHDSGWGILKQALVSKAQQWNKTLVFVDPKYTSQDCSQCGTRVHKSLAQRVHKCPNCGLVLNRDVNAAINILNKSGLGRAFGECAGIPDTVIQEASHF